MLIQGQNTFSVFSFFLRGNSPIERHVSMWLPSRKTWKGLSVIVGCTVNSSCCFVCKQLCSRGFRVISPPIDAFARSSTSGSLCCCVTCLCICISAATAGQRRWMQLFHKQANLLSVSCYGRLYSISCFFRARESSCSRCSHFSIGSYGDATVCVGDAHKE